MNTSRQEWVQGRIEAVRRGDSSVYGELVHEFQSGLRGFIAMLGTPPRAVEGIARDTFVTAYRKLKLYRPGRSSFDAWLRGIACNLVRQWRTKRRGDVTVKEGDIVDHLISEEIREVALTEEESYRTEYLHRCIEKLPERVRCMVDLTYFERKKSVEVAEVLALDATSVRVALCRVRLKLRDCIDKQAAAREVM